jgi:hypothetical protein
VGWRGTAVLAIALLAAAFVLYRELVAEGPEVSWTSVIQPPRDAPPGEQIVRLLSFDPARVTALRLQRGGQEWRSRRSDGGWSGAERRGDIDDFLASLLGLAEIMPLDVSDEELPHHGLDPPEAVVELERADQPPVVLFLGRRNPPGTGVYAQLGPRGRVVLTGALALWDFDKAIRALSPTAAPS